MLVTEQLWTCRRKKIDGRNSMYLVQIILKINCATHISDFKVIHVRALIKNSHNKTNKYTNVKSIYIFFPRTFLLHYPVGYQKHKLDILLMWYAQIMISLPTYNNQTNICNCIYCYYYYYYYYCIIIVLSIIVIIFIIYCYINSRTVVITYKTTASASYGLVLCSC